jgi:hypothetical protein
MDATNIESPAEESAATPALALVEPRPAVLDIDTIEPNRTVVHLREWLAAQAPWRRQVARAVRERIAA